MFSLVEEFKCSKVTLEMTLRESCDPVVAQTAPTLSTGRKWSSVVATKQAKSALRHQDIMGHVQLGKKGLGIGESRPCWHKATPSGHRGLVVEEVRHQQQALRHTKAVSQGNQDQWTAVGEDCEEETFMEGAVGNGGKSSQLPHSSSL